MRRTPKFSSDTPNIEELATSGSRTKVEGENIGSSEARETVVGFKGARAPHTLESHASNERVLLEHRATLEADVKKILSRPDLDDKALVRLLEFLRTEEIEVLLGEIVPGGPKLVDEFDRLGLAPLWRALFDTTLAMLKIKEKLGLKKGVVPPAHL